MEAKMVGKAAVTIAGFVLETSAKNGENFTAIPRFLADYYSGGKMEKLHGEPFLKSHGEYGACFPENPETGEFEYIIGVEIKDEYNISTDYHVRTLPTAMFAVFTTPPADGPGFPAAIQKTWRRIFGEWLPASGYEFDKNGIDFEFYDERCMSETGKVCDIYIPVIQKKI